MQTRYTSADQWAEAKDGVIPAPYALEEGEQIIDQYLEPVIFHNVNGPDIGVTTCGVIVKDGLYFKDLDNSGELAPYKDWRLSPEQRAEDMVKHLRLDQQAGLVLNTLFNTPVVPTRAEATNAEGKLELGKIYKHHNPGEKPMPGPLPGMTVSIDDSHVLEKHIAAGVYRGDMRCEAKHGGPVPQRRHPDAGIRGLQGRRGHSVLSPHQPHQHRLPGLSGHRRGCHWRRQHRHGL